jgi:hypothetical protein
MNSPVPSTHTTAKFSQSGTTDNRLHGQWLVIAHVTLIAVFGLVLALFIASIPTYFAYLHTFATGNVVNLTAGQLTQNGVRNLHVLGLSIDFYASYHIVLNAIFVFGFLMVGGMIFWRKADDRMGLFTAFALLTDER